MRLYHFTIRWPGGHIDDQSGTWLLDAAAARDHGERLVRELKTGNYGDPGMAMIITDKASNEIFNIPFDSPR